VAERVFVDTNVLLYAHDQDAGERRAIGEHVLRQLWKSRSGVLSIQVLQEFYAEFTRRLDSAAARRRAREIVEAYSAWPVVRLDTSDVLAVCEYADRYQVSVWDASILSAAKKGHADVLLSDKLSHGWHISGLEIRNPFS
jgi:predicted nucleic acid-binding protein